MILALEIVELNDGETRGRAADWRCQLCNARARAIYQTIGTRRRRMRRCAGHGRELVERFMRG